MVECGLAGGEGKGRGMCWGPGSTARWRLHLPSPVQDALSEALHGLKQATVDREHMQRQLKAIEVGRSFDQMGPSTHVPVGSAPSSPQSPPCRS
jgi:hypothetical protein